MDKAEIDREVRLFVYRHFVVHGMPPDVAVTATALGYSRDETERSFRRLGESHALVFTPGTVDIWMASPFCALPTTFDVTSERGRWWGTCVWDSFGIPAALDADATIRTSCPDCEEPMEFRVEGGELRSGAGVAHFAVPARHWWDDIGYT